MKTKRVRQPTRPKQLNGYDFSEVLDQLAHTIIEEFYDAGQGTILVIDHKIRKGMPVILTKAIPLPPARSRSSPLQRLLSRVKYKVWEPSFDHELRDDI